HRGPEREAGVAGRRERDRDLDEPGDRQVAPGERRAGRERLVVLLADVEAAHAEGLDEVVVLVGGGGRGVGGDPGGAEQQVGQREQGRPPPRGAGAGAGWPVVVGGGPRPGVLGRGAVGRELVG